MMKARQSCRAIFFVLLMFKAFGSQIQKSWFMQCLLLKILFPRVSVVINFSRRSFYFIVVFVI